MVLLNFILILCRCAAVVLFKNAVKVTYCAESQAVGNVSYRDCFGFQQFLCTVNFVCIAVVNKRLPDCSFERSAEVGVTHAGHFRCVLHT